MNVKEALLRDVLERIADKWTLLVIEALELKAPTRFAALQRKVGGVSQKMLTRTLRQLERDGLVTRTIHAEVPPRVEYRLTRLGSSLGEAVCSLWLWVEKHMNTVASARRTFDAKHATHRGAMPRPTGRDS